MGFHLVGSIVDCICDVLIASAAAEIAFQSLSDLFFRRIWIAVEDLTGRHNHSRRTVTALQTVLLPESFLHRMQLTISGKTFDSRYLRVISLNRKNRARFHRL